MNQSQTRFVADMTIAIASVLATEAKRTADRNAVSHIGGLIASSLAGK